MHFLHACSMPCADALTKHLKRRRLSRCGGSGISGSGQRVHRMQLGRWHVIQGRAEHMLLCCAMEKPLEWTGRVLFC
jgi:hypothetical protein